jgi:hypothetical protein
MKKEEKEQAELRLSSLPESMFAAYWREQDLIVLDARKLSEFVAETVESAKKYHPNFDVETVWVCKFASIISHETIHRVLHELVGKEASCGFDKLYFAEFMEKIPPNSIDTLLWSDALETCPIGDTWFR